MNPAERPLPKNNMDMPMWEHIGELRRRLLKCVAAIGLAFAALAWMGPERILNLISALLTPPDVMSQIMMAIPSILLFECSIRCAAWAERSREQNNTVTA